MPDAGDEAPGDGGHQAMVVEISLAVLHFLLVEQAHAPPFAVCKPIDDWTPEIVTGQVVDRSAAIRAYRCHEHDHPYVQIASGGMVCGWSHDKFGGHRDDRALQEHEKENRAVVEIAKKR